MGDFTLVEPRGWEYDLHSVRRFQSKCAASIEGFTTRYILRLWAISKHTISPGIFPLFVD